MRSKAVKMTHSVKLGSITLLLLQTFSTVPKNIKISVLPSKSFDIRMTEMPKKAHRAPWRSTKILLYNKYQEGLSEMFLNTFLC